jgi:hypothetical protein
MKLTFKSIYAAFGLALLSATTVSSQSVKLEAAPDAVKKYSATITVEELKDHLYILASDDYEGRETGELGQKKAADYIARFFMQNGLTGPVRDNPNPYFQPISFRGRLVENVSLRSANAELEYGKDFISRSLSDQDFSQVELVFAGYGLEKEGYNDFAGIDARGKGVVILDGEPTGKNGEELMKDVPSVWRRLRTLSEKGAAFVLVVYPTQEQAETRLAYYGQANKPSLSMPGEEAGNSRMPFLLIAPDALAELFGVAPKKYYKAIEKNIKKNKPMGGLFSTQVELAYRLRDREITSENVLGFMEGTDLKEEIVVITSHYDHVGVNGGEVYNGADDDGSGTVGVLEIAHAFAQAAGDGARPRRSILFMTVTGEEKGLLGSRYYTDNPVFPLANTVTNLNIDMIGRVDPEHEEKNSDYVYIIGSDMLSSELDAIHKQISGRYFQDMYMDYKYNTKDDPNRFYYRSDHYNFAKHNIPIIFYFNGTHEDYHQAGDTPDKINYPLLAKRARLVFATAWEIANRDRAPVVDRTDGEMSRDRE